jgi:hypothetical protein
MNSLTRMWKVLTGGERRRSDRMSGPTLVAYYWTGSRPEKHEVRDISPSGIYVVTEDRWYPGSVVKLTLQLTDGDVQQHIAIEAKAMRWGEDGVGLSFIMRDSGAPPAEKGSLLVAVDRKGLEKFLRRFWQDPE